MRKSLKKIALISIFALLISFFPLMPTTNYAFTDGESDYYIVKYTEPKTVEEIADLYNISVDKVEELTEFDAFRIELKNIETNIGGYTPDPEFTQGLEYYEPDYRYSIPDEISSIDIPEKDFNALTTTPNDPYFSSQWGLTKIDADDAWDSTTGSSSITIAIIDTGIDGTHADLSGKVLAGYDYVNNTSISANTDSDDHGHGTTVGGVAAAITNNSTGVAGTDWNARLMPVKVLDSFGYGYASDVAYGIRYAADNGAEVINMSLGSSSSSSLLSSAVDYAYGLGVVMVAASGNGNTTPISYPARYTNTIAVGATNSSDTRCDNSDWGYPYGSNYGSNLDVVAPGNSIYGPKDGGGYRSVGGTSLATPFVAGLAGLLVAYNSSSSVSEIYSNIKDNADKVAGMGGSNFHVEYGYGRINANSSIDNSGTYNYSYVSQNAYPTLAAGDSYAFTLVVQNTGSATWDQSVVHLGTDRPQDRIPFYILGNGWTGSNHNRIQMQESSVAPGAQANFNFGIDIPPDVNIGTYREYFRLVADGFQWMEDYGIYWNLTLARPYHSYVSQTPHTSGPDEMDTTVNAGDTINLTLTVTNTGSTTWSNTGLSPVRLGTSHAHDRVSSFGRGTGWLSGSTNRVEMDQASVAPGATATFTFQMIAPSTPGDYREYFQLVQDFYTWMEDYGIYWNIRVE